MFPLGMCTAATHRLAGMLGTPWLLAIPRVFVYVALLAWVVTLVGLVHRLVRSRVPLQGEMGTV